MTCRCKRPLDGGRLALLLGVIGLIASATPVFAQTPRIDTVAFVVDADGSLLSAKVPQLQYGIERALRRQRRLAIHDVDRRLALHAGKVPTARLSEAVGLLRAGEALLQKHRAADARRRLTAAVIQLRQLLAYAEKAKLARAQFLLAVADIMQGRTARARRQFVRLQIWRPGFNIISRYAPGKVLPLWEQARRRVHKLRGGSIVLASVPAGALAYVDGRFVGTTPARAEALPAGIHYVTYKRPGYLRVVAEARVSSRRQHKFRRRLSRAPGRSRLRGLLARVGKRLGRPRVPAMTKLGALVRARHLVFLRRSATDRTRYAGYVYDAETGKRLSAVHASVPTATDRAVVRKLARALYVGVRLEPEIHVPPLTKRTPPPRKRHHRGGKSIFGRWWFWAGLAAGAAIPAVLSILPESGPSCPSGFMCGRVRF